MKLNRIILGMLLGILLLPIDACFASVQDFYFEDFTADYYLTKAEDGTSKLHVKEILTAIFPETNQNHGITRMIPFTNQNGKNTVVENEAALNLTVLRNGVTEPVSKIEKEDDYYMIYIGSASSYVHGKQIYTLEYDYTDVITEFDKNGNNVSGVEDVEKAFQELYWDTNGTGWSQRFESLTARLHLSDDILEKTSPDVSCYVGSYGAKGTGRCAFSETEDGFVFSAKGLNPRENLTFAVQFEAGSFAVINATSYLLILILIALVIVATIVIIYRINKYKKIAEEKDRFYKETFVAPQYQPMKDINVAEAEQIYFKRTEKSYVATLLELAVDKKISVAKDENSKKKKKWSVTVEVEPTELTKPQINMLKILKGGGAINKGDSFPIEKHTATRSLANLAEDYRKYARENLGKANYLESIKNYTKMSIVSATVGNIIGDIITKLFVWSIILMAVAYYLESLVNYNDYFAGGLPAICAIIVIFVATICISSYYKMKTKHFERITKKGIEAVRYLEGLELYIDMAEEDRIKLLQSVDGADTTGKGIVRLYEKLLPWASLFGNEESWVKELAKYYEVENVTDGLDADFVHGMVASSLFRDINRAVVSSTAYHESSGGGGSSWSSGGGGGGFSGGGGGGGGGGGW